MLGVYMGARVAMDVEISMLEHRLGIVQQKVTSYQSSRKILVMQSTQDITCSQVSPSSHAILCWQREHTTYLVEGTG